MIEPAISSSSCCSNEPFIKLEENGKASILNYNLPQSTCYDASTFLVLDLDRKYFNTGTKPQFDFWDEVEKLTVDEIKDLISDEIDSAISTPIFVNPEVLKKDNVCQFESKVLMNSTEDDTSLKSDVQSVTQEPKIANVPISSIAKKIKKGFRPALHEDLTGKVTVIYLPKPIVRNPQIVIEMKLKMCSFLGDYGAGRTVKTFSLLPGERTTISIRNWEHNEISKKQASNVLDSLSESSSSELQSMIEKENAHSSGSTSSGNSEFSGGVGINLGKKKFGLNANFGGKKSKSFSSSLSDSVRVLVKSTTSHVSKTDSLRQIEINSETSSINITENEETIVRQLENINKSRVLNFVFRQLLQEFFTITYLDDVSIIYSDGYAENKKVTSLSGLDDFLGDVIPVEENRDKVKSAILNRLCSIYDYEGTRQSFIECVQEELSCDLDCDCLPNIEPEMYCYFRKQRDISQTYNGKTVHGIILDTTHRVIRTPALVVDALLGQGEALDCYNQKLQDAAVRNANLSNEQLQQAILTIDGITDPVKRAKLYKKVFGDCCDVAQSGGDCSCNSLNS